MLFEELYEGTTIAYEIVLVYLFHLFFIRLWALKTEATQYTK